jgi:hypothetical protein
VAVRAATASGVRPPLFEAGTEQDTGGVEYKLLRLPPGREGNTRNRITSHVQSRERDGSQPREFMDATGSLQARQMMLKGTEGRQLLLAFSQRF